MRYVIVHAVERSIFEANAPSAPSIDAAFAGVQMNAGGWVGPRPRITRRAVVGQRFVTEAAALYGWPDGQSSDADLDFQRTELRDAVDRALHLQSSDWQVQLEAYAPAVNGDAAWWETGEASITHTRDVQPTGTGRVDADENPTGPTTDATHPSTPAQLAQGAARAAQGAGLAVLWPIAGIAAAVVLVWLIPRGSRAATPAAAPIPRRGDPEEFTPRESRSRPYAGVPRLQGVRDVAA